MEILYIDKFIDPKRLQEFLSSIFPSLTVFHYDFNDDPPEGFDSNNEKHIIFNLTHKELLKELSIELKVFRTPKVNEEERSLFMGKKLTEHFNIRVMIPVIDPLGRDPYICALFDKGNVAIVDDSQWAMENVTGSRFKFQESYCYPNFNFDSAGNLLNL